MVLMLTGHTPDTVEKAEQELRLILVLASEPVKRTPQGVKRLPRGSRQDRVSEKPTAPEPNKLNGRFVLLDTSFVVSGGEGGTIVEGDLTFAVGFMWTPNLHGGLAVGLTGYGADDVDVRLLGRIGCLAELDEDRTSFLELQVSAGALFGQTSAGIITMGPGILVALGERSGALLRFGVDLSLVIAEGPVVYSFAPTMGFGGHF
jgi:hypothetical protein